MENKQFEETDTETDILSNVLDQLNDLSTSIQKIQESSVIASTEIKDISKLYHSEFSGRLSSMQEKLDHYQEIEKGRIYDEIFRDIARIYSNYFSLLDDVTEPKVKKGLTYLFDDILQVLESYKVSKLSSKPGEKRNTRHCQIREKILTDDPEKHDTIACSKSPGFFIDNRTLVKEIVDVYIKQP